jgi:hypothetical protein
MSERSSTVQFNTRLRTDLRERLRAAAEAQGRTETWLVARGLELILVDSALTPELVEQLRADLETLRAQITDDAARHKAALERVTRQTQAEWLERVRARQEEKRAVGRWPWTKRHP